MAKVQVQVEGGAIQQKVADTVGELKTQMGMRDYTATVNGDNANDSYELVDFDFVSLAKPLKAG